MKLPSFDLIGNIAVLPENTKAKTKIANYLLKNFKNIQTVVIKTGIHFGKYRIQKTKILAGKRSKTTIHKENNIQLELNIDKTYFSPRLSTERLRIAKLVKKDESVLVLFSGIAPYPITIEKFSQPKEIYAIEINKQAHNFAKENLKLNKSKKIKLYNGDVKIILPKIKKKFNRIIMPLPQSAELYLDLAIKYLKPKGIIHLYTFQPNAQEINKFKILKITKCGQYSPGKYRICLDLTLT